MKRRRIREYQIREVYGVSVDVIRRWTGEGRLHPIKPSPRIKLYDVEELERVLDTPEEPRKPVIIPFQGSDASPIVWPGAGPEVELIAI